MTKRSRDEYAGRAALNSAGWQVEKTDSVRFNSGSETPEHLHTKAAVCHVLRDRGYRVSTEVVNELGDSEADVVAYGKDEPPFVVECETGITSDVKEKKLNQFFHGQPFCECYILEVNDAPTDITELHEWVSNQL